MSSACLLLRENVHFFFQDDPPVRFKKRVPEVVDSFPNLVQKFVRLVCKQGIDPKKGMEVGNFGYDSGYDW